MTKWIELARENNGHIFPTYYYWKSVQRACKIIGVAPKEFGILFQDDSFGWMTKEGSFTQAGETILALLERNNTLITKIKEVNTTKIPPMLGVSTWFLQDLSSVSGEELLAKYKEWEEKFLSLMEYSIMGTVMEFEQPLLSNTVMKFLESKTDTPGDAFATLTLLTKLTSAQKEERALLVIKQKYLSGEDIGNDMKKHLAEFAWVSFNYDGPGWNMHDLYKRLEHLPNDEQEVQRRIDDFDTLVEKRETMQEKLEQDLSLSEHEKYLCETLRTLGFWKFERKSMNSRSHWMMQHLMQEIAKRCEISLEDAKSILPHELEEVLLHNKVDKEILRERRTFMLVVFEGFDDVRYLTDDATKSLVMKDLEVDDAIQELHGMTAYKGYAKGKVKIIDKEEEMAGFEKGDILVSASTSPEILPAMEKAGAIVTNSGGITCHAAIVARELGKPTVIGTKIATKVLKDGDIVEVDATNGVVKKL